MHTKSPPWSNSTHRWRNKGQKEERKKKKRRRSGEEVGEEEEEEKEKEKKRRKRKKFNTYGPAGWGATALGAAAGAR